MGFIFILCFNSSLSVKIFCLIENILNAAYKLASLIPYGCKAFNFIIKVIKKILEMHISVKKTNIRMIFGSINMFPFASEKLEYLDMTHILGK